MSDIKIDPGKPIQGLNPNLAMFANESTTFSQVKASAMEAKDGESSMDTNLGDVKMEIDKGIEAKMSESDDADAQMQELNRLSNDLSQQANVAINTKAELTVAIFHVHSTLLRLRHLLLVNLMYPQLMEQAI